MSDENNVVEENEAPQPSHAEQVEAERAARDQQERGGRG